MADDDVPDADVIVATWWETAEWVWALSPAKGAKVHFVQHWETWGGDPARVEATYRLPMGKIVVADWLREGLGVRGEGLVKRKTEGVGASSLTPNPYPLTPIWLVPNSVDLAQFHAAPRGKSNPPTVGMMYSLAQFKGSDIGLRAYELAAKAIPDLRLVMFGHDAPPQPLGPQVQFTRQPPQEKLREIYAQCDAWLFTSRLEGFGLPLLEAMACRTPVIATPAGAAPELLAGGGGILVKPEDPQDMANAIQHITAMEDAAWRVMSDAAYATATRYTWEEATGLFERALFEAAAARVLVPSPLGRRLE